MHRFIVILLLLFDLHTNSGHSIKNGTFTLKNNTNDDVYTVITKPNNVIEFVVPKSKEPTIREILLLRVIEKPYNQFENWTSEPPIEPSTKPPTEPPSQISNAETKPRPFTNGHGYQFLPWSGSDEVAEEYADAEEDLHQEVEKAQNSRKEIFNAAKEKYKSSSPQLTVNSRQKRDVLKSIPPAPTLPPFNVDQVPELIRRMLGNEKMAVDSPTTERAWPLNEINNADAVINNTMSFFPPPTALNLKTDYVPKTYGMSLKGNEGFTWNNLADPRRPQDINFGATKHNDEIKPKESIIRDPLEVLKALLRYKIDTAETEGTKNIKIAENDKTWNHEFQNVEDSKQQSANDKANTKVHEDVKSIAKQEIKSKVPLPQDLKVIAEQLTTEIPSKSEVSSFDNSEETDIDVRNQMEEMFSRIIPPAPKIEDAKHKSGTYGMVLSNGIGEIWNNVAKPQATPINEDVIFSTHKPHMDNQTKNIEPTNAEIKPEDLKIFQHIFDEEEKIRIGNKSQEYTESNNLDRDETIPSIIFFDDNEVKVINPRSNTESTMNKKDNSVDDVPTPPKLHETKGFNEISHNTVSYKSNSVQNSVRSERDGKIEETVQEKMEKSFKNIMNQISGFKPVEIESDNNKNVDRNIKVPSIQSNSNPINLNKLGRGLDGTYGMELKGDFGYVWNKLSPNYYDYNVGQQQGGDEVEGHKDEDDKHTKSPMYTNTADTTTKPYTTTEQSNKETTGTPVEISTSTTTITTTTTDTSTIKPVLENNTTKAPAEQGKDKDCNSTGLTSNSNISTTTDLVDKDNTNNGITTEPASSATTAAFTTSIDTTTVTTTIPKEENPKDSEAGKEPSEVSTEAPCTNGTTMNATETNSTKPTDDHVTNSTPNIITITTEGTTIPSSVDLTTTETTITTESTNSTIAPIEETSTPTMPSNDTSRPLNLNDLLQSEKFWQWLSNWTIPYMEVMNETVKELVKEEVAKQLANKDSSNNKTEPMTEKPVQDNEGNHKNNTDTKDSGNNTSMKIEAQTIYGNSLNDDHVTNIFVFYPNKNNTIDDIKNLINGASKDVSNITNDLNLNTINKPVEGFTDKEEKLESDSENNAGTTTIGTTEKNLGTVSDATALSTLSSIVTQAPHTDSISTSIATETMIGSTTKTESTGSQDPIELVNNTDSVTTVHFDKITTESSTFANEGLTTLKTVSEETTINTTEATEYTNLDLAQKTTPQLTTESINDYSTIAVEIDKITDKFQSNDGITEITIEPKQNITSNIVDSATIQSPIDNVESTSETMIWSTAEVTSEDKVIEGHLQTTTDYLTTGFTTTYSTENTIEMTTDVLNEITSNIIETAIIEEDKQIEKDVLGNTQPTFSTVTSEQSHLSEQAASQTPNENLLDSTEKDTQINNQSTTVASITVAESESEEKLPGKINNDQTTDMFFEITTESTTAEVSDEKNIIDDGTINNNVSTLSTTDNIVDKISSNTTEISTVNDKDEDEVTARPEDDPELSNSTTANYETSRQDNENSNDASSVIIDSTTTEGTEVGPIAEKVEGNIPENITDNVEESTLSPVEFTTVFNNNSESFIVTEDTLLETTTVNTIKDTEDVTNISNMQNDTEFPKDNKTENPGDEVTESAFENITEVNSDNLTTTPITERTTDSTKDTQNFDDDSS